MTGASPPGAPATANALVAGAAGAAVFAAIGFPGAWLAGPMVGVAVLVAFGKPARIPDWLRAPALILVGMSIGAALTPQTLSDVSKWPVSLSMLWVNVALIMVATSWYFRVRHGWRADTAFFAGLPGALSTTFVLAERSGADLPTVLLAQSIRLFALIAVLPLLISAGGGVTATPVADAAGATDLAIMGVAAVLMGVLFARIGVPAGYLVGALVASGGLHITGLVTGRVPEPMMIPGFIVLGAFVGASFTKTRWATLKAHAGAGLMGFLVAFIVSLASSSAVAAITGLPLGQVLLAYAPGGQEAMAILAFALDLDPAFVGTHQIIRFVGMSLVVPLLVMRLGFSKTD